ncbi:unnamed protein product [Ectocarpus sp. 13 AM-2016]
MYFCTAGKSRKNVRIFVPPLDAQNNPLPGIASVCLQRWFGYNMSGGHAVWRPFKVNGDSTRCTVCRQRFSDEERVQANPPTAEQPGWKNIRCYPGCAQAAKSRVPSKGKRPPRPIIFGNQFATTRCCLCNNRIAVGARMKATKIGHMWHDKRHDPSCTSAPSSRRSGACASDSGLGGGGGGGRHVSSPPRAEDPARKRPRSVTEERERPQKERRGGAAAAAAAARPGSGAQSGARSRPAPRRGPTAGTAGSEEVEVECVRALTSTQRIDERISQRQRELGVIDVEDDDDDSAASCRNLAVKGGSRANCSRSRPLPVVRAKRSKADHPAAASCRNIAVSEGWVIDLSSSRSRPLLVARAKP